MTSLSSSSAPAARDVCSSLQEISPSWIFTICPTANRSLSAGWSELRRIVLIHLFFSKENGKNLEGETVIDIQKYNLYQVKGKIMKRILKVLIQHKNAIEFEIENTGVFKKEKGMRKNREKIISYGDEKEMLEGDFYKPEKPTSPFFSSGSSMLFHNKTG